MILVSLNVTMILSNVSKKIMKLLNVTKVQLYVIKVQSYVMLVLRNMMMKQSNVSK